MNFGGRHTSYEKRNTIAVTQRRPINGGINKIQTRVRSQSVPQNWARRSLANSLLFRAFHKPESPTRIERPSEYYLEAAHCCHEKGCNVLRLNVSGLHFYIREAYLREHPTTLLGDEFKRRKYYDSKRDEFFFDRHRPTFEAIFAYFQTSKLRRPQHVPDDIFISELQFFEIERDVIDKYKIQEGYIMEELILPASGRKRMIWTLFEYPGTSASALVISIISVTFTLVSIAVFCIETLPQFSGAHCEPGEKPNLIDAFFIIETLCTLWFTMEYFTRLAVCPSHKLFLKDFKNWIDMLAVLPYYVTLITLLVNFSCEGAKSAYSLDFLRVVRLVRVFKLTKHSSGLQIIGLTIKASMESLGLFLVALMVCVIVFSSTIYYVESGSEDTDIQSIPDAFWWAIVTMCTIGYGDKIPKSLLGKIVGCVCALTGVLTLAIPVPIITENFNKFYSHKTGHQTARN